MRNTPLVAMMLVFLLPACSPDPGEAPGVRTSAIMFGQTDSGHAAVGLLTLGGTSCGGTLVSPDAVLTAARCVTASAGSFVVGGFSYPVSKSVLHPAWATGSVNYDFAIVSLGQAVTGVAPATLATTAPKKGDAITLVGFGETGSGMNDGGYRRVTTNVIADVQPQSFSFTGAKAGAGNLCTGDAGGASFRIEGGQERLVGVHSAGSEPCGVSGLDGRVDAVQGWLELHLKPAPAPTPTDQQPPTVLISEPGAGAQLGPSFTVWVTAIDGESGLASIRLVVDGQERGTKAASPATFDLSGLASGVHTLRADATDSAGNVGSSEVKVVVEGDVGPGAPGPTPIPRGFGSSCSGAKDCASGLCASDPASSTAFCTQLCNQLHPCPEGSHCLASGKLYLCALGEEPAAPAPAAPGARPTEAGLTCSLARAPVREDALPLLLALAALALRRRRR
jgi:hypothetical protein